MEILYCGQGHHLSLLTVFTVFPKQGIGGLECDLGLSGECFSFSDLTEHFTVLSPLFLPLPSPHERNANHNLYVVLLSPYRDLK